MSRVVGPWPRDDDSTLEEEQQPTTPVSAPGDDNMIRSELKESEQNQIAAQRDQEVNESPRSRHRGRRGLAY